MSAEAITPIENLTDLKPIERRVLAYLDQRGPTERRVAVCDLANPDSNAGRGFQGGSNGAAPLIMGAWCRRLIEAGLVVEVRDAGWQYRAHKITPQGQILLRGNT
jgi:hypothetical protein